MIMQHPSFCTWLSSPSLNHSGTRDNDLAILLQTVADVSIRDLPVPGHCLRFTFADGQRFMFCSFLYNLYSHVVSLKRIINALMHLISLFRLKENTTPNKLDKSSFTD